MVLAHVEQAGPVERLQRAGADGLLDVGQPGRLPGGDQLHGALRLLAERSQPRTDDLGEPPGRRQGTGQAPLAPLGGEHARDRRLGRQLAQEQHVALRPRPERVDGGGLHGTAEHGRQQRLGVGPRELGQLQVLDVLAPAEIRQGGGGPLARAHRGHQRDGLAVEQLADERQRGGVEVVGVVDHEHEGILGAPQPAGCALQQGHRVELAVEGLGRQQRGEGGEGHGGGGGRRGDPQAGPAPLALAVEQLVGEAALADAG
jgi:hypothetical protein